MLPTAVAVSVVTVDVPPIFSVPVAPLVKVPAPASAVPTVKDPLFVYVPLTVTDGIENVPLIVLPAPLKVWIPVPALNDPAFERLPGKVKATLAAVLFHVPPALTVTSPLKALVPVAEDIVRIPLVPPPTVVVPVTVKAKAPAVKVVPSPTTRSPPIARAVAVDAVAVPLNVKLPLTVVRLVRVFAPEPESVKFL